MALNHSVLSLIKNGFIRAYDGTTYLVLFEGEKYAFIYSKVRYLIRVKSGITYIIHNNYVKMKVDLYTSLPLEKILTLHNIILFIKLVFNKHNNNNYYNIFLEKSVCQLPKNNDKNKFLYKLQMLYFNRIDVSEGAKVNKTSESRKCDICY